MSISTHCNEKRTTNSVALKLTNKCRPLGATIHEDVNLESFIDNLHDSQMCSGDCAHVCPPTKKRPKPYGCRTSASETFYRFQKHNDAHLVGYDRLCTDSMEMRRRKSGIIPDKVRQTHDSSNTCRCTPQQSTVQPGSSSTSCHNTSHHNI